MSTAKPVYVSSSGTLGSRPLTVRISDTIGQYATLGYLFVETLLSPIINPSSWANPSARPPAPRGPGFRSGPGGSGGGGSGGGGGGGGGGGYPRGGGGNGGGGFMTLDDLNGGGSEFINGHV
ncbi:hypothetical protein JCM24511_09370 [Saitozyma sp. JCM 24511]|nr:hypothetical protein JCM24511_09370 [Saitozyma sp. JCM 24511]